MGGEAAEHTGEGGAAATHRLERAVVVDAADAHEVERREDAVRHLLVLPPVLLVLRWGGRRQRRACLCG